MNPRSLDHVVVVVSDLNRAAAVFEDIGFVVTQRSDHPFGTSNRLIVLANAYIELIAVTDPSLIPPDGFARFVADSQERGDLGPIMAVLRSADPESDHQRLLGSGLPSSGPVRFGRWVDTDRGDRVRAEFVSVFTGLGSNAFSAFFCQHLTPELVWNEKSTAHPNGAERLSKIVVPDVAPEAWDRMAWLASTHPGDHLDLSNVVMSSGAPRLVVTAEIKAGAMLDATVIDLMTGTDNG